MLNNNNLALAIDVSYNTQKDIKNPRGPNVVDYFGNRFISKTQKALILRENILASGMEVSDITKASDIAGIIIGR